MEQKQDDMDFPQSFCTAAITFPALCAFMATVIHPQADPIPVLIRFVCIVCGPLSTICAFPIVCMFIGTEKNRILPISTLIILIIVVIYWIYFFFYR